jgi:uroporphyrinogen-III decarboxylase
VQLSAEGMDAKELKDEYGDSLVFWGAATDTQKTLPFGTPEEVGAEAEERCRILSRNGGFVFNAIHNIQAKTPVENIAALAEAARQYR